MTQAATLAPDETALRADSLLRELAAEGLMYAVIRQRETRLDLLVAVEDLSGFEVVGRRLGLRVSADAGVAVEARLEGDPDLLVVATSQLAYGSGLGRVDTPEREERVLRRAAVTDGVRVAAPQDELFHTLLHCILDLGAFPEEDRRRLRELVARLRGDPVAAGRASERIQQELAPALTWSGLLADLLHERWGALVDRRRRLRLHLALGSALRSPARLLGRAWTSLSGNGRVQTEDGREGRRSGSGDVPDGQRASDGVSRKQIRGSGLLLTGRGFSSGLKFASELVVVRYLTTVEYGAWTYALSAVLFLRGISTLGLNRAVARFVPIHLERGEHRELLAVVIFVLGLLGLSGAAVITAFYVFPEQVASLAGISEREALDLLFIVVFMVPVEAIDDFLTGLCAVFTDSRTIFVRRYLINPGLRLAVALTLVLLEADVYLLAYGYLLAGLAGVAYYGWSVFTEMRRRRLIGRRLLEGLRLPARRVLSYSVPVMTADWCSILMTTAGPLLLGYFSDMGAVALFNVVVPLVAMNRLVAQTFGVLFEPAASRLHARREHLGLERLYWRSAVWVSVLTFPAFAVSFTASEPLTVLLFGDRYAEAAPILSIMAAGMFFDSIVGFNSATLRVAGAVRWLLGVNVAAALLNVGLNLVLIPSMGALGAGIATGTSLIAHAVMRQAALRLATGMRAFDPRYASPYVLMALTTAGFLLLRVLFPDRDGVLVGAAATGSLFVLLRARATLSITETFPELARWPLLMRLLG